MAVLDASYTVLEHLEPIKQLSFFHPARYFAT